MRHAELEANHGELAGEQAIIPAALEAVTDGVNKILVAVNPTTLLIAVHRPPHTQFVPVGKFGVVDVQESLDAAFGSHAHLGWHRVPLSVLQKPRTNALITLVSCVYAV